MPIDKIFLILKKKFLDLAIILSNSTKRIFCKAFNWLTPVVYLITILELINSSLNLELLYYKLINIIEL